MDDVEQQEDFDAGRFGEDSGGDPVYEIACRFQLEGCDCPADLVVSAELFESLTTNLPESIHPRAGLTVAVYREEGGWRIERWLQSVMASGQPDLTLTTFDAHGDPLSVRELIGCRPVRRFERFDAENAGLAVEVVEFTVDHVARHPD